MSENTETEEVIVINVNIDGRDTEFLLTDLLNIDEQRYGVLYSDDDMLAPEDRTLFAKVVEEDLDDRFELVTDPVEVDMVAAHAALNAIDDLLLEVRSGLREISSLVSSIDQTDLPIDTQKILGIIGVKSVGLLEALNEEAEDPQFGESDD